MRNETNSWGWAGKWIGSRERAKSEGRERKVQQNTVKGQVGGRGGAGLAAVSGVGRSAEACHDLFFGSRSLRFLWGSLKQTITVRTWVEHCMIFLLHRRGSFWA